MKREVNTRDRTKAIYIWLAEKEARICFFGTIKESSEGGK